MQIFMDLNMPVMDGKEATTRIQALHRQNKIPSVCIIALTANVRDARCDGEFDDALAKPLSRLGLQKALAWVQKWFRDRTQEEEGDRMGEKKEESRKRETAEKKGINRYNTKRIERGDGSAGIEYQNAEPVEIEFAAAEEETRGGVKDARRENEGEEGRVGEPLSPCSFLKKSLPSPTSRFLAHKNRQVQTTVEQGKWDRESVSVERFSSIPCWEVVRRDEEDNDDDVTLVENGSREEVRRAYSDPTRPPLRGSTDDEGEEGAERAVGLDGTDGVEGIDWGQGKGGDSSSRSESHLEDVQGGGEEVEEDEKREKRLMM